MQKGKNSKIVKHRRIFVMNKTFSMSIRVSKEELDKLKQAAHLELYASYSGFVRRTALKEADKIINSSKYGE